MLEIKIVDPRFVHPNTMNLSVNEIRKLYACSGLLQFQFSSFT